MHERIREVMALLDESRAVLRAAVDEVPIERRGMRPAPERWATAEVLDHLSKVEGNVAHLVEVRLAAARAEGLAPENETTSVVSAAVVSRLQDRTNRIEAAGTAIPNPEVTWEQAWSTLNGTRATLVAAISAGDGLALGTLSYPHRALGTLNFYQWIVFVAAHEQRHAAQVRDNAARLR